MKFVTNWIPFGALNPGERFRFHYYPSDRVSEEVYAVRGRGWYEDATGKRFRTGKATAVKIER